MNASRKRRASLSRSTQETEIRLELCLDGGATWEVDTGIGFLDHLITSLAYHSGIELELVCKGDLDVDDHHTAEDCALALGEALSQALGDRSGIARFGWALAPLDESLARAVVDLSGRPWAEVHLGLRREALGGIACENVGHFFRSLSVGLGAAIHLDLIRGENDHHRAEAAAKALALALRQAVASSSHAGVRSTKGVVS